MAPVRTWLAAIVALATLPAVAPALTIVLDYRGPGSSNPDPEAVTHPNDPNGQLLMAHVQAAADRWSAIIEDSYSMTVRIYYTDYEPNGAGLEPLADAARLVEDASLPRTKVGRLRFNRANPLGDFYFDKSPNSDAEFGDFTQLLVQDLSPSVRASSFVETSGNADVLEMAYGSSNGPAGVFDLLTTAMHEMGHLMGVTNSGPESADGDFDLPWATMGGATIAALTPPGVDNQDHLVAPGALMDIGQPSATRTLISATDALAAAAGSGWSQINLSRLDYLGPVAGNSRFDLGLNWIGGRAPDATDTVSVRNGANASVIDSTDIGSLLVAGDSAVSVATASPATTTLLRVDDALVIGPVLGGPANNERGTLQVVAGATVSAREVQLEAGLISMGGGRLEARLGDIVLPWAQSEITGNGVVNVAGSLVNSGVIRPVGGTLNIEGPALANPTIDLDGDGPPAFGEGIVDASAGSLRVVVDNAPDYAGAMTIGPGRFVELPQPWRLASGGKLSLNGTATQTADLRGGSLDVDGAVTVDGRAGAHQRRGVADRRVDHHPRRGGRTGRRRESRQRRQDHRLGFGRRWRRAVRRR